MPVYEIAILLALTAYAIFRQTQRHEVVGNQRFKLAIIYGIVGVVVGGFSLPRNAWEIVILVVSVLMSVVVGLIRGHVTTVWRENGVVYSQGTALSITLFLLLVLGKFGLGTFAYLMHVSDDGGFGEILLMIAIMVAFQAQIIWRRAQQLGALPAEDTHLTDAAAR